MAWREEREAKCNANKKSVFKESQQLTIAYQELAITISVVQAKPSSQASPVYSQTKLIPTRSAPSSSSVSI